MARKRILSISNSNNILNWKKIYQKNPQSFKLITLEQKNDLFTIPNEFLAGDQQNIIINTQLDSPKLEINIKKKKNSREIVVELTNYTLPFLEVISKNILDKLSNFSDLIDLWAINFDLKGKVFKNIWYSFRTPKNREIILSSIPYLYKKSDIYTLSVKVVDIFGIETESRIKIKI